MYHIKIKENESIYGEVHFPAAANDLTLCGLEIHGDDFLELEKGITTKNKVTCKHCIEIVEHCKSISKKEYN